MNKRVVSSMFSFVRKLDHFGNEILNVITTESETFLDIIGWGDRFTISNQVDQQDHNNEQAKQNRTMNRNGNEHDNKQDITHPE